MVVKKAVVYVVLGLSFSLLHIGSAQAAVSYAPPVSTSVATASTLDADNPEFIAKGDLDGLGGINDLVTVNETDGTVTVLLRNGAGLLTANDTYSAGTEPRHVAIGNLDGINGNDLVIPNTGSGNITVLMNNGSGVFTPHASSPIDITASAGAGVKPTAPVIADLNGDTFADIAVSNDFTNNVQILLGDGGTTFTPVAPISVGLKPTSMTAGDLDADLDTDLVVANFDDGTVSVLANDGFGVFTTLQTLISGAKPWSIQIALIDLDSVPDIALANYNANTTVRVYKGVGDGTFGDGTPTTPYLSQTDVQANKPHSVEVADLNGDSFIDIVVANDNELASPATSATTGVTVLWGNGSGTFPAITHYPLAGQPNGVVSLDLDAAANQLDLAVANGSTGNVDVLLSVPSGIAPVADDGVLAVDEDTAKDGMLVANDDNSALMTYSIVTNGTKGTAVITNAATGDYTYTPTADLNGGDTFTFKANDGTADSNVAMITVTITAVNDLPTGAVIISGTATEDQALTASNTLADADGLGAISYQWQRGVASIAGATASTYTLGDADVGSTITVVASYTDLDGTAESVASGATAAVANVNDVPTGSVSISGTATEDQALTASNTLADADGLGTISYQWQRGGTPIAGATASTYTLGDADVGSTITVVASYTDLNGTAESVASGATAAVANVNDTPTGGVSISGTVTEDQTLTANSTLADNDGLGSLNYQWERDSNPIAGATSSTYLLGDADVGAVISLSVSYTDLHGTAEGPFLDGPTAVVVNVNDAPTGSVSISGTATEDQTLTASNTLADNDGLGSLNYQWERDSNPIVGATSSTYLLGDADVGAVISLSVSYTDLHGTAEGPFLAGPTAAVANVNDVPTGSVSITGTATEDQTLTASNTLADADGLGAISYQWQRGGAPIAGATASTYTLGDADVGSTITVVASYTDLNGTAESVASGATAAVANVNDTPTGGVSISGTVTEDQTLTANSTLADNDGLGSLNYQWERDSNPIVGATSSTYLLGDADVGAVISLSVSYTDLHGTAEGPFLAGPTAAVANVNDVPTGSVSISGTATEDQTLTASNTLADADGLGTISYQWQRGGVPIAGATASTYTLGDADVGSTITVVASYTDLNGTAESVASGATAAVANVNDAPTITGAPATNAVQDILYTFTPTAGDVDAGASLTFSINKTPTWATFDTGTGTLTGTPTNADVGITTTGIVISVNDGIAADVSLPAFDLTVSNTNDEPTIGGTPATTVAEGSPYSFTPTASDPDVGDTLTFIITNQPTWASFDTATGALTGTPGSTAVGTTTGIVISVSDATVSVSLPAFDLEVTALDSNADGISDGQAAAIGLDPQSLDTDGDGISDADEVGVNPASPIDTDGDGIIDALEFGVADPNTLGFVVPAPTATTLSLPDLSAQQVTLSGNGAAITANINGTTGLPLYAESDLAVADASFTYPFGVYDFSVAAPAGTATVTLTLPVGTVIPTNAVVRKLSTGNQWRTFTAAVIDRNANTITLTLTDNDGVFDLDATAGIIRDPVGVAVPVTVASTGGGGGGGCSLSAAPGKTGTDPILPLMALTSLLYMGRQRKRNEV